MIKYEILSSKLFPSGVYIREHQRPPIMVRDRKIIKSIVGELTNYWFEVQSSGLIEFESAIHQRIFLIAFKVFENEQ